MEEQNYTGNAVTYYNRNFYECSLNPEIKPEYVYAIWTMNRQYHVASFRTLDQLMRFGDLLGGFSFQWDEDTPDYKHGRLSVTIRNGKDITEINYWLDKMCSLPGTGDGSHKEEWEEVKQHLEDAHNSICCAYGIAPHKLLSAKPYKGLSNGSIVDNLFWRYGNEIELFACNPNYKRYYHPLSTPQHIEFQRVHGVY